MNYEVNTRPEMRILLTVVSNKEDGPTPMLKTNKCLPRKIRYLKTMLRS